MDILDRSIENYEFEYKQRWSNFPDDYKLKMSKGIMAFEIRITDLQAKKKLSQNRTETEQKNIIGTLSTSTNTNEKLIAEYMKNNLKSK